MAESNKAKSSGGCCGKFLTVAVVGIAIVGGLLLNDGHHSVLDLIKGTSSDASDRTRIGKYDAAYEVDGNLSHNDQEYTNMYYDLATDFYEYGWGQSFHFATRYIGETFTEHIKRHEYFLASKLGIQDGMKVLDMGMGVGGPLRNIARFTNADITGVTINHHQVNRAKKLTAPLGPSMTSKCHYKQGDFTKMDFLENESFDRVYSIEATCHVMDRVKVFSEAYRVLKPGGLFASYEWLMTDNYDPTNEEHKVIKRGIEHGDGLPELIGIKAAVDALKDSGFEVVDHFDLVDWAEKTYGVKNVPWYQPLEAGWNLDGWKHTVIGRKFTEIMVRSLEAVGIAPKGSYATAKMLEDAATHLVKGGQQNLFTPMYLVIGRKPMN
jgi:sterol 24-C-methyltransferase